MTRGEQEYKLRERQRREETDRGEWRKQKRAIEGQYVCLSDPRDGKRAWRSGRRETGPCDGTNGLTKQELKREDRKKQIEESGGSRREQWIAVHLPL